LIATYICSSSPGKSAKRVFALDVPGIHALSSTHKDVDGRDEPGHDEEGLSVWIGLA
jgi:hypothetical protein